MDQKENIFKTARQAYNETMSVKKGNAKEQVDKINKAIEKAISEEQTTCTVDFALLPSVKKELLFASYSVTYEAGIRNDGFTRISWGYLEDYTEE